MGSKLLQHCADIADVAEFTHLLECIPRSALAVWEIWIR